MLTALAAGTRFGLDARRRQETRIAAVDDLASADRLVRALIARLDPAAPVDGAAHGLSFVSAMPGDGPRGRLTLTVNAARELVLTGPFGVSVLARNIARLDMAYWPAAEGAGWSNVWTSGQPPELIRPRLIFPPGDPRRWPDIVAAPQRSN